jgi:UDP-4-amino-4,6-dideoxy-N-acetyl-beta-L-altrosamine transaminase
MRDAFLPYGRQLIDQSDIDAVVAVLKSDMLTQGPAIEAFEAAICSYTGAKYAAVVNSATSALHIACLALDVGPGDLVWTSPNSFVASSNCALYCGADVDFVDIAPVSLNMCAKGLASKLAKTRESGGRLPKVVIPVHFAGEPCDMEDIAALAKEYGFKVIEDASHAIGATYGNQKTGACEHSDVVVLSFHPVKIITTAEGGAALCKDPVLASRLARLRTHGITRDPAAMVGESHGPWYYQQIELGLNYRITDLQAALGTSQLKRIDAFLDRRHQIADRYDVELAHLPLKLPVRESGRRSALHLYVIQLNNSSRRLEIFEAMRAAGIGVNVHYIPIHTQAYYRGLGFNPGDFPVSEDYYAAAISIPMHAGMTDADIDRVVGTLNGLLS